MIQRSDSGVWWLHPAWVVGTSGLLIAAAAYALPESIYRQYWRTPKFFELASLEVTVACVAVFVFGALLGQAFMSRTKPQVRFDRPDEALPWRFVTRLFHVSFYLCLLGYALWIGLAVQRGMTFANVAEILAGEKGAMYDARFSYLP